MLSIQEIIVRLLVALVLCGLVGLQRYITGKAAGMRTHILVGMGAAMFTLVSAYSFKTSSPDRIAAQIVTGIGFIGGGAILKERGSIKGMTTAAGLWASAALGMAAGAGSYRIAVPGTVIILITLAVLGRAEGFLPHKGSQSWTVSIGATAEVAIDPLREALDPYCKKLVLERLVVSEGVQLVFFADILQKPDLIALTKKLRAAGAASVTWEHSGNVDPDHGP
jgi:uncharacterized membrane protein YhiD involved in acid resistance